MAGGGLSQVRRRVLKPAPHEAEHALQLPQVLKPPSTRGGGAERLARTRKGGGKNTTGKARRWENGKGCEKKRQVQEKEKERNRTEKQAEGKRCKRTTKCTGKNATGEEEQEQLQSLGQLQENKKQDCDKLIMAKGLSRSSDFVITRMIRDRHRTTRKYHYQVIIRITVSKDYCQGCDFGI